jgi:hypothetical protein
LADFVATLKELFQAIFQSLHDHTPRSTAPTAADGRPGDIVAVDDGSTQKIYCKTGSGWKSASLS